MGILLQHWRMSDYRWITLHIKGKQQDIKNTLQVKKNSDLQVIQRFHLHDWAQGVERQRDINALVWHQWSVDGQGSARDDTKARKRRKNTKTLVKRQDL